LRRVSVALPPTAVRIRVWVLAYCLFSITKFVAIRTKKLGGTVAAGCTVAVVESWRMVGCAVAVALGGGCEMGRGLLEIALLGGRIPLKGYLSV